MTILRFKYHDTQHNFIWAPKCSGTNLWKHLRKNYGAINLGDKYNTYKNITHYPFSFFEERNEVNVNEVNFTIIRDPLDRLQSFYKTALKESYFDLRNHTIDQIIEIGENHRYYQVMPHADRLPKDCSLYHIDNLQDLEQYLNLKITSTQHNKSDQPQHQFSEREIDFIYKYYKKDFDLIEIEKYQRDDANKISHIKYNFDKNKLYIDFLKNLDNAKPYEDHRKKVDNWKIIRCEKSEYIQKICQDLGIEGDPRFYILEKCANLPQHLDHGTQCSINVLLSDGAAPISFMDKQFYYDACLINTQLRHGVNNGNSERILFKLSIKNKSYNEVKNILEKRKLI